MVWLMGQYMPSYHSAKELHDWNNIFTPQVNEFSLKLPIFESGIIFLIRQKSIEILFQSLIWWNFKKLQNGRKTFLND